MESNSHLELLELTPDATLEEVRRNYLYLRKLFSGDSVEIRALHGDFSEESRGEYLVRLDQAFQALSRQLETRTAVPVPRTVMDGELAQWVAGINCFNGAALRGVRERMGVNLKAMYAATRIQIQYLEDLENEEFSSFRAEVYLRSYLSEYSRFLALDTQRVLSDYLPRYRAWTAGNRSAAS